jgi:peptidoglycan hydrolase-like protein with peptidoglycan-binding domain
MALTITAPVGENGFGKTDEVKKVQRLLNCVPVMSGGPWPRLDVDGVCGPVTRNAIRVFQSEQLGFADGRVDPNQETLKSLNS